MSLRDQFVIEHSSRISEAATEALLVVGPDLRSTGLPLEAARADKTLNGPSTGENESDERSFFAELTIDSHWLPGDFERCHDLFKRRNEASKNRQQRNGQAKCWACTISEAVSC